MWYKLTNPQETNIALNIVISTGNDIQIFPNYHIWSNHLDNSSSTLDAPSLYVLLLKDKTNGLLQSDWSRRNSVFMVNKTVTRVLRRSFPKKGGWFMRLLYRYCMFTKFRMRLSASSLRLVKWAIPSHDHLHKLVHCPHTIIPSNLSSTPAKGRKCVCVCVAWSIAKEDPHTRGGENMKN